MFNNSQESNAFKWWNEIIPKSLKSKNFNPFQPPFRESFLILYNISPLLSLFVSDLKVIKDNFLEETLTDISEDENSLDDFYLTKNSVNNEDDDIDNFDIDSYINNQNSNDINFTELCNNFWNRIYDTLKTINFNSKSGIINPLNDFPNFVKYLFEIKDRLDPAQSYINLSRNKKVLLKPFINDIIQIISHYSRKSDAHFIIWELPEALHNSDFIYFSLLLELSDEKNSIWTNFCQTEGSLNLFFDHYFPLLGPSDDTTTSILLTLIDSLFRNPETYEQIKHPKKQANFLWFKLMRIIGCSNSTENVTTAFLVAKSLYLQITPISHKNVKIDWLDNLIDASSNGTMNTYREFYKISSDYEDQTKRQARPNLPYENVEQNKIVFSYRYCPVHYQALEFIFSLKVPNFKFITLCKNLIHQGIKSPQDLIYIQRCLMAPKTKKPILGIKFLLNLATSDKIWSPMATQMLYEPLTRFSKLESIQVLFLEHVKKSFVFISVSITKNKYSRKILMILNVFKSLYCDLKIPWLNSLIQKYYASLVFSKKMKNIIPEISLTTQVKITKSSSKVDISRPLKKGIKESVSIDSGMNSSKENRRPSISSFNSAFPDDSAHPKTKNQPEERVQCDKMFSVEVERVLKSQIDLKKYLNPSSISIPKTIKKVKPNAKKPKFQLQISQQRQQKKEQIQKLQLQKKQFNDRLKLQRQAILKKREKIKEKQSDDIKASPSRSSLKSKASKSSLKSEVKKPEMLQVIPSKVPIRQQLINARNHPKTQAKVRSPHGSKPCTPLLIQPTLIQIQRQQEAKKKKMEIQKMEPIDTHLKKRQEIENNKINHETNSNENCLEKQSDNEIDSEEKSLENDSEEKSLENDDDNETDDDEDDDNDEDDEDDKSNDIDDDDDSDDDESNEDGCGHDDDDIVDFPNNIFSSDEVIESDDDSDG